MHRALLNVFMSQKTMSDEQARESLQKIGGEGEEDFDEVIAAINSNLDQLGMEISHATCGSGKIWGIANKARDVYSEQATVYSQPELQMYLKVVEKVIATHGGVVDKHECILLRGKLSIDQAEASMNNMCKDGWLSACTGDDDEAGADRCITLGDRSHIDLREYLKTTVDPPLPPVIQSAVANANDPGSVTVDFEANADEAGAPTLHYVVTCSPGAATFTGAQSPISVSLPIGRYTFTVKAVNFGGESEASAPSGVCEVTGVQGASRHKKKAKRK